MADQSRPVPAPDEVTRPYWEAAKQHRLMLPKCQQCGHISFPPKSQCPECGSPNVMWMEMSGRGTVHSFCIMHDNFIRGFDPPYLIAHVDLEEQPELRLTSNILNCPIREVWIGMPVEVTFEEISDEFTLPQFQPRQP